MKCSKLSFQPISGVLLSGRNECEVLHGPLQLFSRIFTHVQDARTQRSLNLIVFYWGFRGLSQKLSINREMTLRRNAQTGIDERPSGWEPSIFLIENNERKQCEISATLYSPRRKVCSTWSWTSFYRYFTPKQFKLEFTPKQFKHEFIVWTLIVSGTMVPNTCFAHYIVFN